MHGINAIASTRKRKINIAKSRCPLQIPKSSFWTWGTCLTFLQAMTTKFKMATPKLILVCVWPDPIQVSLPSFKLIPLENFELSPRNQICDLKRLGNSRSWSHNHGILRGLWGIYIPRFKLIAVTHCDVIWKCVSSHGLTDSAISSYA